MTNKSGAIGTRTETAIVRHARANGFAGADEMTRAQRLRLNGARDQGDIGLCPGVVVSSKGGHMAEQASDAQIAAWLAEVEVQRRNRGVDVAFLVTKRKGKGAANAGHWWAHMAGWLFVYLAAERLQPVDLSSFPRNHGRLPAVRLTLADALTLLRAAGYGDRVEPECPLPPLSVTESAETPSPRVPVTPRTVLRASQGRGRCRGEQAQAAATRARLGPVARDAHEPERTAG